MVALRKLYTHENIHVYNNINILDKNIMKIGLPFCYVIWQFFFFFFEQIFVKPSNLRAR